MAQFERQSPEVTWCVRMACVFLTELEVWRRPPEQSAASVAVGMLKLAPASIALLISMRSTSWQVGGMAILPRLLANDGVAAQLGFLVEARAPPQEHLRVSWINESWTVEDDGRRTLAGCIGFKRNPLGEWLR